jgi:hypothetical protein
LSLRLVQFRDPDNSRKVARVLDTNHLQVLKTTKSVYELALGAIRSHQKLGGLIEQRSSNQPVLDYDQIVTENRLLPPVDHPDPARLLVSGTGLDHLGSAMARDAMHTSPEKEKTMSDSMKMFRLGLEGGKPKSGEVGSAPEWFYKGDGSSIVAPGQPLELPSFALDGGEEAEVVGVYVISDSGEVFRLGYTLGNEYSDHILERQNYLYLAHSKLRDCSIGPELLIGALPNSVTGQVSVIRDGKAIWSSAFQTGEANMTHSISNIEHHHFKYDRFRRPNDVHCHFFGASVLSFSSGISTHPGDVFEIYSAGFGRPLRNSIRKSNTAHEVTVQDL